MIGLKINWSWLLITLIKRKFTHGPFGVLIWAYKGFRVPAPNFVKKKILSRVFMQDAVCVETGTYLGETTCFLAKFAKNVITIEPQMDLYNFTKRRLSKFKNIEFLHGTSEELLPRIVEKIKENHKLNFWLDGHYSGGFTFQGVSNSPILYELEWILPLTKDLVEVVIAIDDFRDFNVGSSGYPSRSLLISFAEKFGLSWDVQMDIFFMKKRIK